MSRIIIKENNLKSVRLDANTSLIPDQNLVDLALSGHDAAFQSLMERHQGFVVRLTSRFLFNKQDVQEVVQDTFVKVWKNLSKYDSSGRFTTWVYTINFNLCLDRLKALKRRPEVQLNDDMLQRLSGICPDDQKTQELELQRIADAVRGYAGKLSKIQRMVFVLRDLNDLSVDEVCHITGFAPDKVKANLFHARKILREKLVAGGYIYEL